MRGLFRLTGLGLLTAGLAYIGWLLMGTAFMIHDDEGYVLIGLRNFAAQGRLYDGIFTQYGPVPFLYHDLLHRLLDHPIDNQFGRAVTLAHWIGAALAAGLIAWRLSGRYWTALFASVLVFGCLWQMTWEPSHPGGLIAWLAAFSLAGAVEAVWRGWNRSVFLLLGCAGAALLFTKINVGLLWCCSAGAFLLLGTGGVRRPGSWLAAAGLAIMPFVLMRSLLGESWVLGLAVMSALAGAAVCLVAKAEPVPEFRAHDWLAAGMGLAAGGAVIVAATLASGTTVAGLLQGVVLDPLRHPLNFHLGFHWQPFAWVVLGITLLITGAWCWRPAARSGLADVVAGLRLLTLGFLVWRLEAWLGIDGARGLINYVMPLTPLFLLPLARPGENDRRRTARLLVALMGLGQVLHAYPVAGSQLGWGCFLLLPLLADGLAEAAHHLAQRLNKSWPATAIAGVALTVTSVQAGLLLDLGAQRWRTSDPLGLPGAEGLRPPEHLRYALRILTANAKLHADVLYSRPGMFGFNLWSDVPTPTLRNATHWFWLLTATEQQAIIAGLQAGPRSAIISSQLLVDFLHHEMSMVIAGPLQEHIVNNYRTLFSVTGYDFLVPRDSPTAPFYVAQNFSRRAGDSGPAMIAVNVAREATVARIALRDVRRPEQILALWGPENCRVTLEPINLAGQADGEPQFYPWPLPLAGLRRLSLYHTSVLPAVLPENLELVFLDTEGRSLFEACYDQSATSAFAPPAGG